MKMKPVTLWGLVDADGHVAWAHLNWSRELMRGMKGGLNDFRITRVRITEVEGTKRKPVRRKRNG